MTLKQNLTKMGKIGLVSLISLPITGCEEYGIKKASPKDVENRIGYYAGFRAKSINRGIGFQVSLLDTTNAIYLDGQLYGNEERFSTIEYGEVGLDGKGGKLTPGSNSLVLKYANPDSLLAVHRTLKKK